MAKFYIVLAGAVAILIPYFVRKFTDWLDEAIEERKAAKRIKAKPKPQPKIIHDHQWPDDDSDSNS